MSFQERVSAEMACGIYSVERCAAITELAIDRQWAWLRTVPGPGTKPSGQKTAVRLGWQPTRGFKRRCWTLFPPLARGDAKPPFEAGVEKAQVVKTTLNCY